MLGSRFADRYSSMRGAKPSRTSVPTNLEATMTTLEALPRAVIATIYDEKPASYFANARHDIVALLRTDANSAVLELGCGAGGTGRAVMAANKAGRYVGLELNEAAAEIAAASLSEVIVGDVQTMDLARFSGQFDALIVSEVLEHLTDPWATLGKLSVCLKPGAVVFASSPNIAYWGVVKNLIKGRFEYRDSGVMDQTHLRWFTPESFRQLFESAGINVSTIRPMREPGWKGRIFNALTGRRFSHLLMAQMLVVGERRD